MYIEKKCLFCENQFSALEREIKRGNAKFCSRSCSSKHGRSKNKSKPNSECAYCGNMFHKRPSSKAASKSGLVFCCREHKDLAQRLEGGIPEIYPSHYSSGKHVKYRNLLGPIKTRKCNRCGYNKYPEIIIAHHIDRNRNNNKASNIEALCSRCHDEDHFLAKDGRWA